MAITFYNNWKIGGKDTEPDDLPEFRVIELVFRQLDTGSICITISLLGFGMVILISNR